MFEYKRLIVGVGLLLAGIAHSTALSFDDVIDQVDTLSSVELAALDERVAAQQFGAASDTGDLSLSLTPSIDTSTSESESFAEYGEISASVSASIPLGLSSDRTRIRDDARDKLDLTRMALGDTRSEAFVTVYRLYQHAWLAQQEVEVLSAELAAAEEQERVTRLLFDRGDASLFSVNDAAERLYTARTDLLEGTLTARIAWLELAHTTGIDPAQKQILEPFALVVGDIPRPPELTEWALANSVNVRRLSDQSVAYTRERETLPGVIAPPLVRATFSGWEQSASASFNLDNRSLGVTYAKPLTTFGTEPAASGGSSSAADTWQAGVSVTIPLQIGASSGRDSAILAEQMTENEIYAAQLHTSTALAIRSSFQAYLLNDEAVPQAERTLLLAESTLQTIIERRSAQQATLADELLARAQVDRARFRLEQRRTDRTESLLLTAQAASYLQEILPE